MSWCWTRILTWRKDLITYNSYPWIMFSFNWLVIIWTKNLDVDGQGGRGSWNCTIFIDVICVLSLTENVKVILLTLVIKIERGIGYIDGAKLEIRYPKIQWVRASTQESRSSTLMWSLEVAILDKSNSVILNFLTQSRTTSFT